MFAEKIVSFFIVDSIVILNNSFLSYKRSGLFIRSGYNEIKEKRKFTTFSNKSQDPVFRSLACVGSSLAPGLIRGPPRDLDPVGSTQYDGCYFTKEITAGGTISPRK